MLITCGKMKEGSIVAYGKIKKGKIVVTMSMKDYEFLNNASVRLKKYEEIFKRAKLDGTGRWSFWKLVFIYT